MESLPESNSNPASDSIMQISIRAPIESDRAFIMSSWLRGNRFGGNDFFTQVPQDVYFAEYTKVIDNILNSDSTLIRVASDAQQPLWTAGYSVSRGSILYWVYVKPEYRKQRIATLLLANQHIEVVKSTTKIGRAITYKKNLIFNPF